MNFINDKGGQMFARLYYSLFYFLIRFFKESKLFEEEYYWKDKHSKHRRYSARKDHFVKRRAAFDCRKNVDHDEGKRRKGDNEHRECY